MKWRYCKKKACAHIVRVYANKILVICAIKFVWIKKTDLRFTYLWKCNLIYLLLNIYKQKTAAVRKKDLFNSSDNMPRVTATKSSTLYGSLTQLSLLLLFCLFGTSIADNIPEKNINPDDEVSLQDTSFSLEHLIINKMIR